jgi:hypothetical protein
MARLFCLECQTIVGESTSDWQGDRGSGFGLCQTCGQHGGRAANARAAAGPVPSGERSAVSTDRLAAHRPDP